MHIRKRARTLIAAGFILLFATAAASRTPESPALIAVFYSELGLAPGKGRAKAYATFRKEDVEVAVIGPPRKDAATGKKMNDRPITITKRE